MNNRLSSLKEAKIEWLLQIKKRLQKLTRDFQTYFHEIYPLAQKSGGIRAALASLAILEEIEGQLAALRATVRTMLTKAEQEALTRECRSRRSDAYERAIDKAIATLKAEIKADSAVKTAPRRPTRGVPAEKARQANQGLRRGA